jgi:bifunctional non-homologous end joining protein LigD
MHNVAGDVRIFVSKRGKNMKRHIKAEKFVIQEHTTAGSVHWDLMLESGNTLLTWRLDKGPAEINGPSEALKIFDHPLKFLTYEGPVNKGKGRVKIADAGTYEIMHENDERIELDLHGQILKGKFTLTHVKDDHWQFSP